MQPASAAENYPLSNPLFALATSFFRFSCGFHENPEGVYLGGLSKVERRCLHLVNTPSLYRADESLASTRFALKPQAGCTACEQVVPQYVPELPQPTR